MVFQNRHWGDRTNCRRHWTIPNCQYRTGKSLSGVLVHVDANVIQDRIAIVAYKTG